MEGESRHRAGSNNDERNGAMTRIVITEFVSLDGVMDEPRWTFDFDRGEQGDKFKFDELFDAEALLLGRVTYQGFAAAWPSMGHDDFGKRMNEIHKYVVSSTLADGEATWGSTMGTARSGHFRNREAKGRAGRQPVGRGQRSARSRSYSERFGRRVPPDGVPGHPRGRQ